MVLYFLRCDGVEPLRVGSMLQGDVLQTTRVKIMEHLGTAVKMERLYLLGDQTQTWGSKHVQQVHPQEAVKMDLKYGRNMNII